MNTRQKLSAVREQIATLQQQARVLAKQLKEEGVNYNESKVTALVAKLRKDGLKVRVQKRKLAAGRTVYLHITATTNGGFSHGDRYSQHLCKVIARAIPGSGLTSGSFHNAGFDSTVVLGSRAN